MSPRSPVLPSRPDIQERVYAKDQPEYIPLPTVVSDTVEGAVTSRWHLTWRERLQVLFRGSIWLTLLTFRKPLQPVLLQTKEPKFQ